MISLTDKFQPGGVQILIKQLPCKTFTKRAIIDPKMPSWKRQGAQNDTFAYAKLIKKLQPATKPPTSLLLMTRHIFFVRMKVA
jgi:hypothetical protein